MIFKKKSAFELDTFVLLLFPSHYDGSVALSVKILSWKICLLKIYICWVQETQKIHNVNFNCNKHKNEMLKTTFKKHR